MQNLNLAGWDALTPDAIREMTREQCIAWLMWNDHNASYDDAASVADGMPPMSLQEARDTLHNVRFAEDYIAETFHSAEGA